jgi:Dihydrofolate reductase
MGTVSVFNFLSLNGFYKGENDDISWSLPDPEQDKRAEEGMASANGILLFGRKTYEMMASFWPTAEAAKNYPGVAEGINRAEKIVFSKSLKEAKWNNSRVMSGDLIQAVRELKNQGRTITILGSGTIVTQLAEAGLIDGYEFLLNPVALGAGTSIFSGAHKNIDMELLEVNKRANGIVHLRYRQRS